MVKFTVVDQAPAELRKGEYVIAKPTFLDEIQANLQKTGRNGLTGVNHLRYIVDTIGMKYNPNETNGWSVRPNAFEGRPFKTHEELSKIVVEMLEQDHPVIFKKYVEYQLNHLPPGTDTVYFENFGIPVALTPFFEKGLTQVTLSDLKKKKNNTED